MRGASFPQRGHGYVGRGKLGVIVGYSMPSTLASATRAPSARTATASASQSWACLWGWRKTSHTRETCTKAICLNAPYVPLWVNGSRSYEPEIPRLYVQNILDLLGYARRHL